MKSQRYGYKRIYIPNNYTTKKNAPIRQRLTERPYAKIKEWRNYSIPFLGKKSRRHIMKIELLTILSMEINPLTILIILAAICAIYAIKRGYDHSGAELTTKARQGQRIY